MSTYRLPVAGVLACLLTCPLAGQEAEKREGAEVRVAQAAEAAAEAARARAAIDAGGPAGVDPNSFAGKESNEGVYVRDSALALEKFAVAQRMERLKEWNKSADLYQEVIEKYPDRVVPARTNADDKIVQYTSVTRGVTERLARWPKEGLDVYRARYEPTARGLLDAAGPNDLSEMHKVFYRYFVTDAARDVGMRLIDINLERGEFHAAARLADELLGLHPGLFVIRPQVLYRSGLAHRLAGDDAKAKERLAALAKDHPEATDIVRGKEVKLAESLAKELQTIATVDAGVGSDAAVARAADSWMTSLGGDATHALITPAVGRTGALLWAIPFAKPQWAQFNQTTRAQLETTSAANTGQGLTTGVFPVVDRRELFFQDGARVYARSLESGVPLPGWAQTYPGPENRVGQYVLPNIIGAPRTHQLSLTLTDRAVLGIMGQPDTTLVSIGQAPPNEARLVCLDRATGRENWVTSLGTVELPRDLPDDQQKSIRALQMNGSPLVIGDSVLVSARGLKPGAQFEDCWVLCFQLGSGKHRWSCYVASASSTNAAWGMRGGQLFGDNTTSHLAYANGRVYVLSNLGALAALDAYSGTIVWLDIYERGGTAFDANQPFNPFANQPRGGRGGQGLQLGKPWIYNPVVLKDERVFLLPSEGRFLYIYDANNGMEVKRVRRADFGGADVLLAVMGERVIMAGERRVYCVNWRDYDADNPEAALVWSSGELPDGMRGRPFVTSDSVFLTTPERMFRYSIKTGKAEEVYPKYPRTWDEKEEGPGNVLVTGEHVIISGATHVYGYTDLGLARQRLDRDVAAAPADAGPRLSYAEIMFTAGEHTAALAKLDEAIQLLGGIGSMRTGVARDRTFNDALSFAQKLAENVEGPETKKLTDAFFDRAGAAAASPQQNVHYRLSRARFAVAAKDAPAAARFYQEILSSAEFRPVALLDDATGGPTQAADVAEAAIRELIGQAGANVYAPYEQAAIKQLEAALAATPVKPQALLEVAQTYPNSKVAARAMVAAAESYESSGNPRSAVQVLRQMYFKYPDAPDKARTIEAMARNYLALPGRVDVAAARLALGLTIPGEHALTRPLRLPDGREIAKGTAFAAALDELRKYSGQAASKSLPDFRLPVPPKYLSAAERKGNLRWPFQAAGAEQIVDGVAALATPLRDYARGDRIITWSRDGGRLDIYKPGEAKALASGPPLGETPKGSAWVGNEDAVVWSASSILMLNERGAPEPVWRVELKDLPAVEIVKVGNIPGAGDLLQQQQRARLAGNVQVVRRNNQAFIMQNGQPRALPQPGVNVPNRPDPTAPEQITEARPVGDRVLVATSTGRVFSVDLTGGRVVWQTRLSDRAADRIAANEDFTVLKVTDETSVRLIAMDTYTGQLRGVRAFATASGANGPCNIALSADGTLVYTLPDQLVLKDLYKPWDAPERIQMAGVIAAPGGGGGPPYTSAIGPDQLVIAEGRILALAEAGTPGGATQPRKYVRVHSLETGQPITLRVPQEGGGMADLQLDANTDSWDVRLRVIGPRLYIINPRTALCYNLDRPEEFWAGAIDDYDDSSVPNIKDAFFGQKHVVLLSQPGVPQPRKGTFNLLAYGRYSGKANDTAESGRLDYEPTIVEEQQTVTQWQGVEGGFYYLTGDAKLHFLAAAQ